MMSIEKGGRQYRVLWSTDDGAGGLWPVGGRVDADPSFVGWFAGPLVPRIR